MVARVSREKPKLFYLLHADWGKCVLLLATCGLILWLIFPRYQAYVLYSKVEQGLRLSQPYQEMMMHYYQVYGKFPTATDLHLGVSSRIETTNMPYLAKVEMYGGTPREAKLILTLDSQALGIQGLIQAIYSLQHSTVSGYHWQCNLNIKTPKHIFVDFSPKSCQ